MIMPTSLCFSAQAEIIAGFELAKAHKARPFSNSNRVDEAAADLALDISEYFGVTDTSDPEGDGEYGLIYSACADVATDLIEKENILVV